MQPDAEAGPQLGGQFRLAGLQARRSQILELIDWYERQLTRLGVSLLFNTPLDAHEITGRDFEEIVIATGSQPSGTGFQRGLPGQDRLPGVDLPNVWSVEDVMTRTARLGDHVLLIDDTGDWRGLGTALEIVARGHRVTVVTSWPVLGRYLQRTESDGVARARLKNAGGRWITDAVVKQWHGDGATVRSHLDGTETVIKADTLVLATTNVSDTWVLDELEEQVPALRPKVIGDALAPRLAVAAIYEGRVLGQSI
ncbi:hypothetical protein [Mesorhizobium sp. B2-4-12]|uniref:hypothetical protein n=1 Tax=Mesorhizobium sp. B2-4-12 TaxID=2589937 RepID=UPI0032B2EF55